MHEQQPLNRSMLSDQAYEALHEQIINLALEPGRRLNIDRLSNSLGVSPTPLREALRRLAGEDLVRMEAFKGFYVAPLLDMEELGELGEVRALIEGHAAERVASGTSSLIADLEREVTVMDALIEAEPLDVRAFNGADGRFHTALVAGAGNLRLEHTYRKLNAHLQIARLFIGRAHVDARTANEEHQRIADAVFARDGDKARAEVLSHIEGVFERLAASERGRG